MLTGLLCLCTLHSCSVIEGDFGFYPLVRNDFNLSKSNIFAIECIANGMPVLADRYFSRVQYAWCYFLY
jgi:hypothetical protein